MFSSVRASCLLLLVPAAALSIAITGTNSGIGKSAASLLVATVVSMLATMFTDPGFIMKNGQVRAAPSPAVQAPAAATPCSHHVSLAPAAAAEEFEPVHGLYTQPGVQAHPHRHRDLPVHVVPGLQDLAPAVRAPLPVRSARLVLR